MVMQTANSQPHPAGAEQLRTVQRHFQNLAGAEAMRLEPQGNQRLLASSPTVLNEPLQSAEGNENLQTASARPRRQRGSLTSELLAAMGLLVICVLPLSYSFLREHKLCRAYYCRAVAMELVDGEMETLMAGEWRAFAPGAHPYTLRGAAATNLPPGKCLLTVTNDLIRLEWLPEDRNQGGKVLRETTIPPRQ